MRIASVKLVQLCFSVVVGSSSPACVVVQVQQDGIHMPTKGASLFPLCANPRCYPHLLLCFAPQEEHKSAFCCKIGCVDC